VSTDPLLLNTREPEPRPGRFSARDFARMLGLVRPHLRTLILGLLATVLFAGLHTLGIGGAFPVFKILLEPEGLAGWVDRTVAGGRLGVEFAPLGSEDQPRLAVVSIHESRALGRLGVQPFDQLWAPDARPARELLRTLATARPETSVELLVRSPTADPAAPPVRVKLTLPETPMRMRLLRAVSAKLPADTADQRLRTLGWLLVALVVTVTVANTFRFVGKVIVARAVLLAMMELRQKLYARVLGLPMKFFAGRQTSDLVTRFVQDVQEIQRGLITVLGKFVQEPLRAIFILALALTLDWRITLTLLVVAPLTVVIFWAVGRKVKKANRKLLGIYGQMIGALTHTLHSLRVVKAYTAEPLEQQRLATIDRRMVREQLKLARLEAFVSPMMETLAVIAGSCVTVWLASLVLNQQLSPSKFVALGFILSVLMDPLRKLSDVYVRVQRATAGAERIFHLLDHPLEDEQAAGGVEIGPLRHRIEYRHVSFSYAGSERPALRDVTLSIQRGETIAIVGPNGSGKTTLISLLLRLFDPDDGRILYDGTDLREVSIRSLRRQIAYVAQEGVIFGGTPIENIAYGDPQPDLQRVREAARRASADEFIRALPGGYEAKLGERGTTLSGGQAQRLAIARAIYRDAPVLIFDEATSQVDSDSERKIHDALREVARERTTLIIAHRLSTIQFADRIAVLDAGKLLDVGTHAELVERCKLYRNLCHKQLVREMAAT